MDYKEVTFTIFPPRIGAGPPGKLRRTSAFHCTTTSTTAAATTADNFRHRAGGIQRPAAPARLWDPIQHRDGRWGCWRTGCTVGAVLCSHRRRFSPHRSVRRQRRRLAASKRHGYQGEASRGIWCSNRQVSFVGQLKKGPSVSYPSLYDLNVDMMFWCLSQYC